MKVLSVAAIALCVVAVSCMSSIYGTRNYGQRGARQLQHASSGARKYSKGQYGSNEGLRRYGSYDNAAKAYDDASNKYSAYGNNYNNNIDQSNAKGDVASNYYGQKNAAHGGKAFSSGSNARRVGHYDDAANTYASKSGGSKAASRSNYAKNNFQREGNVFSTGVHFGHDKKYSKKSNDDGDYEILDDSSDRNLDEYRTRDAAFNKANKNHADSKHTAGANHALKESKYGKDASYGHYDNGKYGSAGSRSAKKGGARHGYEGKLNEAAGSNKYYDNSHEASRNNYKDFAGKNAYYERKHAADAAKQAAKKLARYGYSQGRPGYGDNGYNRGYGQRYANRLGYGGNNNNYRDRSNSYNFGANAALAKSGKYGSKLADYNRNHAGADYSRKGYNNAQGNDYYQSGADASKKNGYHNQNDAGRKANQGYSHAGADAANRYDKKAALSDSANSAYARDNFRRKYHDAGRKRHLVKKFHHHSDSGGNNYERLDYNRKDYKDKFHQNANAAHNDAKKFAQNYYKNAAAHDARRNNKQVADKSRKAYNRYDSAHAANGNAGKKSNYYSKKVDHAAGAKNGKVKSAYSKHNNAANVNARRLNNFIRNKYGRDGHSFNAAQGAASQYGGNAYNGNGYGRGVGNRVFSLNQGRRFGNGNYRGYEHGYGDNALNNFGYDGQNDNQYIG